MPNSPIGQIRLQGWRGGLNTEADDVTISADELGEATNIKLGINGELEKRKGYATYSTSNPTSMGEGRFLFHWDQLGTANDWFVLVDDGGVVWSTSGTVLARDDHNYLSANESGIETDATGWTADTNCAVAQSAAQASTGTNSLSLTSTAGGDMSAKLTTKITDVEVGKEYTALAKSRSAVSVRSANVDIKWYTSGDSLISTSSGATTANSTSAWTAHTVTATAPATAAKAEIILYVESTGAGSEVHYFDDIGWRQDAGTTYIAGGTTYDDFGVQSGDDDYPVAAAIYDNVFYVTSLRANGLSFDGTDWTEITDYEMDNDGTGSEFPRASSLVVKHERLFAANIDNNGTRERSRIRWSEVGNAVAWGSTSWIDVDPDDGSEIRKIIGFADGIVLIKDRSTFFLSGVDANSFTLFPVDSTIGTQSPGTVVATESAVFFLDDTKGVYSFDGTAMTRISDKINDQLLSDASFANNKFHRAFYFREKYYLSLHDGTDKNITYVYDTRNEAWAKWTNGFYDAAETGGAMYVTGATDDTGTVTAGICTYLSGETDNTETFEAKARTGWVAPEDSAYSQQRFRIRSVDVVAVEGSGTLTVNLYEDFKTSTSVSGSASLDNDNYDHVYRRVNFTPALKSGRQTFQLEFVLDSATATFIIPSVEVQISPRRRQRGANNF